MTNTVNKLQTIIKLDSASAADFAQQAIEATCEDEQEDFESAANNALEKRDAIANILAHVQEDAQLNVSEIIALLLEVGGLDTMLREEVIEDIEDYWDDAAFWANVIIK